MPKQRDEIRCNIYKAKADSVEPPAGLTKFMGILKDAPPYVFLKKINRHLNKFKIT